MQTLGIVRGPNRTGSPLSALSRYAAVLGGGLLLSACAMFSPDGGMETVAGIAGGDLRKDIVAVRTEADSDAARATVTRLLRRPLSVDAAVQVALLNNRTLQAAYNELGIAEAVRVEASLPPNPTFSVERLASRGTLELEGRIIGNILALATLPARAEMATDRFRQAQLRAAEETLRLAAETRRSYYRAVAAGETARFLAEANEAAATAAKLSRRLGETGAMNKLDQAREQVFYAETTGDLARARQAASSARERLARLMGLWGRDLAFRLPGALPPLPRRAQRLPDVEVDAIRRRVDLQIARIDVQALAKSYGLTNATRFLNLLELAGIAKNTKDRATGEIERERGFEVEFQIPLFDFGEARVRRAEESYRQAVNRLAQKAIDVRSEARDAYRRYRTAYDVAAHYRREVLPLRKIISDEMLLRYNAMQVDVFALLTEARQRIAATMKAIDAQRDFWLAATDLGAAVTGGGAGGSPDSPQMTAAAAEGGGH
jgi:outer membrane protein TolC